MKNNIFKKNKYGKYKGSAGYIPALFLLIMVAWYISTFHYQLMLIQGNSMAPSFHNMQLVLLDKHPKEYSCGDVIAFKCEELDAVLVKRIVACSGDTVQIREGMLLINGEVGDVYGKEFFFLYAGLAENPIHLDIEEYFVIGDNLAESKDSRYIEIGVIKEEAVLGCVVE